MHVDILRNAAALDYGLPCRPDVVNSHLVAILGDEQPIVIGEYGGKGIHGAVMG
jgi:hypothetical protein